MTARDEALFLFGLLDDIDTASDIAKENDKTYREIVERLHRRRFEVASTDGYSVFLNSDDPTAPSANG